MNEQLVTMAMAIKVLEGIILSLDPNIELCSAAIPMLLQVTTTCTLSHTSLCQRFLLLVIMELKLWHLFCLCYTYYLLQKGHCTRTIAEANTRTLHYHHNMFSE